MTADSLSMTEAATYLGVSKGTLRNWDRSGKLNAQRNPHNGYRLYRLTDLEAIRLANGAPLASADRSANDAALAWKRALSKSHNIIRDSDSTSGIMERFDELSKILHLALCSKAKALRKERETDSCYATRLRTMQMNLLEANNAQAEIRLPDSALVTCMELIAPLSQQNAELDIRGMAYEQFIQNTFDKSDNQQFFTPPQVVEFMSDMLSPYLVGTVGDPACGTGGFLRAVADEPEVEKLVGLEIDPRLAWVTTLNMEMHGELESEIHVLGFGGSLGPEAKEFEGKWDAILTNPPFGSDYKEDEILNQFTLGHGRTSRRRGILFIEQCFNLLREGGVVGIVIDEGVLNSGTTADVREFILKNFEIMAVVSLPVTTFQPYANVATSILVLRKHKGGNTENVTFFAEAERIGRKANGDEEYIFDQFGHPKLNSDFPEILKQWVRHLSGEPLTSNKSYAVKLSTCISNHETPRLDYLFNEPSRRSALARIHAKRDDLVLLTDVCIERNQPYLPAQDPDATTIKFTGLAHIEPQTGIAQQVDMPAKSIKSAVKRYEPGDIIFSRLRPSLRKVAAISFPEGGYVSSECVVLTPRTNLFEIHQYPSELLASILRSDFVYGQIVGSVTGIGRPRISVKELRSVLVPRPVNEHLQAASIAMQAGQQSVNDLRARAATLFEEADVIARTTLTTVVDLAMGGQQ